MNIKGKVILVGEVETVGAAGFRKRLLVVETEEQYKQKLPIEFVQDKVSLLDNISEGQDVDVSINLRGSEYNGRYYAQISGWKIAVENNF